MDERIRKLADTLVVYSSDVRPGQKVLIECFGFSAIPLIRELVDRVSRAGGLPYVSLEDESVVRHLHCAATEKGLDFINLHKLALMRDADVFIGINATANISELHSIPEEKNRLIAAKSLPITAERISRTKWVVLRFPNNAMAQSMGMNLESFEDFYYQACLMDYRRMSLAMDALAKRMGATDQVHITGSGTDIRFSIHGFQPIKDDGRYNLPGGEVMTAPVRDSIHGKITYNVPAVLKGRTYENIVLELKEGRIISARSSSAQDINAVFDLDAGARYMGEFALGVHPHITHPMKDVLFDEKIAGSFHLTPGNPYPIADNGNRSALHWDLISIQTEEYGGGEIYFDGELVRKDGLFVTDDLIALNPEALLQAHC